MTWPTGQVVSRGVSGGVVARERTASTAFLLFVVRDGISDLTRQEKM
jgi:hypothetical protein